MTLRSLAAEDLARRCDPEKLTVAPVPAPVIVGQPRAAAAVAYALSTPHPGHHLFVAGLPGSGRRALVRQAVQARLRDLAAARSDWVYVNHFAQPHRPLALQLPAGRGAALREDMKALVRDTRTMVRTMFESEEYAVELGRIEGEFKQRAEQAFVEIGQEAQRRGLVVVRTPVGFTVAPRKGDEVLPPEEFEALPGEQRAELQKAMAEVQEQLSRALRASMRLRKEHADRVRELNRSMTRVAAGHALEDIRERHADPPRLSAWLDAVAADMVEHADDFRAPPEDEDGAAAAEHGDLSRYEVNLLFDATEVGDDALVEADLPTVPNLVGRVDHLARFGMLMTDFRLIKGGLLHRANGGHLMIDAVQLLSQPFAWQTLKRALLKREIRIEAVAEQLGMSATVQLEPEPIPLDVKVVLVGTREVCALLQAFDDEFDALFGVVADLGDDMPRDDDTVNALAAALAARAHDTGLRAADPAALAACIDHAARLAEDRERLSAQVRRLLDLLQEADHRARQRQAEVITRADIDAAIAARRERAGRIAERLAEAARRGIVRIETRGERTGQINGLSVYDSGGERFGAPMRISATARLGHGEVIDIQRETHLGGPIHAKGVMILASFIAARYSRSQPHSLLASLVFEQTYGLVEGDSASLAELAALLSAIGELPLKQGWAVTGSVDQAGRAQAVGGVNEKIEGFFDLCAARGLDGTHGVLIPAANAQHLMLREDVVAAVTAGRFGVTCVDSIDDAMAWLTGLPAGLAESDGEDSVNGRVARRLHNFARLRRGEPRALRRPLAMRQVLRVNGSGEP